MDPGAFYGKRAAKVPPEYSDDSDLESSDDEPENAALARAGKHFYRNNQKCSDISDASAMVF